MPKVCIDCRYIGPRASGIGEVVRALVRNAPALAPEIDFLLLKHPTAKTRLSDAPNVVEHVVTWGTNHPASMWLLPEIAPVMGCDLFHAPANILPARLPTKTVTTVHDIMWLTNPNWCEVGWKAPLKRRFFGAGLRRALAHSNRIATVSAATRDAIADFAPETTDRLVVTRSGVSQRFRPVERDERVLAKFGVDDALNFTLIVGQNAPYKNHKRALTAFAQGLAGQADAHIVLVQRRGVGNQELQAIARHFGIEDRVTFTGPVTEAELIQLYSAARLLLHPSLCEGFGNPVAEAMACGCPVITSNRSAMPEVAGGAARLVDPDDIHAIADALAEIWTDEERREAMREAGLKRAKDLQWQDFARANVEIYRELLASD